MVTVNLAKKNALQAGIAEEYGYMGAVELCKGRTPFAYAEISGEEEIRGMASCYYTPLGLVVCVAVSGLDVSGGIYPLSFVSKDGAQWKLPPLYNKNGYAWCSALTGKISVCEIIGGEVYIGNSKKSGRSKVASGVIVCPLTLSERK